MVNKKNLLVSCLLLTSLLFGLQPLSAQDKTALNMIIQKLSSSSTTAAMSLQLLLAKKQVGEALYSYSKDTAQLSSLFVQETYRHQGYGKTLFQRVCSLLKKGGCSTLTFNACAFTYPLKEQAQRLKKLVSFFEHVGAQVVEYKDYVHGMPTTAVMRIDL